MSTAGSTPRKTLWGVSELQRQGEVNCEECLYAHCAKHALSGSVVDGTVVIPLLSQRPEQWSSLMWFWSTQISLWFKKQTINLWLFLAESRATWDPVTHPKAKSPSQSSTHVIETIITVHIQCLRKESILCAWPVPCKCSVLQPLTLQSRMHKQTNVCYWAPGFSSITHFTFAWQTSTCVERHGPHNITTWDASVDPLSLSLCLSLSLPSLSHSCVILICTVKAAFSSF